MRKRQRTRMEQEMLSNEREATTMIVLVALGVVLDALAFIDALAAAAW